jgi:hypothetical protein
MASMDASLEFLGWSNSDEKRTSLPALSFIRVFRTCIKFRPLKMKDQDLK